LPSAKGSVSLTKLAGGGQEGRIACGFSASAKFDRARPNVIARVGAIVELPTAKLIFELLCRFSYIVKNINVFNA
jgi:hypothetical protein